MITIYTEQDAQALADDTLRELVRGHLITVKENGLENLTCIAIVEPADSEQAFLDKLGFSPLRNPLTDTRFGDPDFSPAWDWLEAHPGWYELIFTVGDDGFAYIIFVPIGAKKSELTRLCERYGGGAGF
ncbi:MAG: hypothetical protein CL945_00250 [Dinoroseobacter sp.]|jgi:hypothetical protein|nr:hypothetical protein [Dinoroseobacter sp.]|tara:strand:+ start:483 stop:869 length:387 start_codon:yes stop_codon:yes gene_type:complete